MIYFDNAATTFPKPEELYKAQDYAQRNLAFNAGRGSYEEARNVSSVIDECRSFLCKKANAKEVVFSSSVTSALNMIVTGLDLKAEDIVYYSPYEHNAVVRTLFAHSKKEGFKLVEIPLKDNYEIDIDKLEFLFSREKPSYLFMTHVSNVTGYILPVAEVSSLAHRFGAKVVIDGAQAFGLIDVDLNAMNIDIYCFAGHKTLYGPFGIAGYFTKEDNALVTSFFGGTGSDSLNVNMPTMKPDKYEPSSHNSVAIYGLLASSKWVFDKKPYEEESKKTRYLINKLKQIPELHVYAYATQVSIVSFTCDGFDSNDFSQILYDDFGIATRSGYHCCPKIHELIGDIQYNGTVRVGIGAFNTYEEMDELIKAVEEIINN